MSGPDGTSFAPRALALAFLAGGDSTPEAADARFLAAAFFGAASAAFLGAASVAFRGDSSSSPSSPSSSSASSAAPPCDSFHTLNSSSYFALAFLYSSSYGFFAASDNAFHFEPAAFDTSVIFHPAGKDFVISSRCLFK